MEFRFHTAVAKIEDLKGEGYRLITEKGDEIDCTWLIAGPGRSGAEWFSNQCKDLGIQLINNQVDIGVRVELPASVLNTSPMWCTSPSWSTAPSSTGTRCAPSA